MFPFHPSSHDILSDALGYANHVMNQARRCYNDRCEAEKIRTWAEHLLAMERPGDEDVSSVSTGVLLLRASAPLPRPLSLVRWNPFALFEKEREVLRWQVGYRSITTPLLMVGEHPNSPGRGVILDPLTQTVWVDAKLCEFEEIEPPVA